jgi:hypothetical protein
LMNLPSSLLSAIAGLLAGAMYQSELIAFRSWRLPAVLERFANRYLLPLLEQARSTTTPSQHATIPSTTTAAATHAPSPSMQRPVCRCTAVPLLDQQASCNSRKQQTTNPLLHGGAPSGSSVPSLNQATIDQLVAMGFTHEESRNALVASGGDATVATDILLSTG